eukprot:gene7902-12370_t
MSFSDDGLFLTQLSLEKPLSLHTFVCDLLQHEKKGIPTSTVRHNLKKIRHCFKGKDFVNWSLKTINVSKREEAHTLGQILIHKNFILPALKKENQNLEDDIFDEKIFYRFREITVVTAVGRGIKEYFLISDLEDPKSSNLIKVIVENTQNSIVVDESKARAFMGFMRNVKHEHWFPIERIEYDEFLRQTTIIRKKSKFGSLKDLIHKSDPLLDYRKKYQTKSGISLFVSEIKRFSFQILRGIKAIVDCGFSFPHLSTSNIILEENDKKLNCKISDFEDVFVGMPPAYEHFFYPRRTKIREEIICFGVILYEMSVGQEIDDITLSFNRLKIDKDITSILNTIFIGNTKIQVEDLLSHNFFKDLDAVEKPKKLIIKDTGMLHLFFQIKMGLDKKRKSNKETEETVVNITNGKSSIKVGALTTSEDIVFELKEKEKLNKNNINKPMVIDTFSEEDTSSAESVSNSSHKPKSVEPQKKRLSKTLSGSFIQLQMEDDHPEKEEALNNLKMLLDNGFIDNDEYLARKEQLDDVNLGDETTTEYETSPYLNSGEMKEEIRRFSETEEHNQNTDHDEIIVEAFDDDDHSENSDGDDEVIVEELSDGEGEEEDIIVESF